MNKVLVLDGMSRQGIAAVRSLGRIGLEVYIADVHRIHPARFSKFAKQALCCPSPVEHPKEFEKWLLAQVRDGGYAALCPLNDHTFEVCTRIQDELRKYTTLLVNDIATYNIARDKRATLRLATELGIPAPQTWFPETLEDIRDIIKKHPNFPMLLKPARSSGSRGLKRVDTPQKLTEEFKRLTSRYGAMLLQEYIPGNEIFDVCVIFNAQGKHRGSLVNNRLRMYPRNGGPNVSGHAVIDEPLREHTLALLQKIEWKGVAQVEFKIDERDNAPKLMEINPRFWGTTQLGISAGMDWPAMYYQIAHDGDCEELTKYRTDMLMRWLIPGELLYFLSDPRPWKMGKGFFRLWGKNSVDCVFSAEDPMPGFGLLLTCLVQIFNPKMLRYVITRN